MSASFRLSMLCVFIFVQGCTGSPVATKVLDIPVQDPVPLCTACNTTYHVGFPPPAWPSWYGTVWGCDVCVDTDPGLAPLRASGALNLCSTCTDDDPCKSCCPDYCALGWHQAWQSCWDSVRVITPEEYQASLNCQQDCSTDFDTCLTDCLKCTNGSQDACREYYEGTCLPGCGSVPVGCNDVCGLTSTCYPAGT